MFALDLNSLGDRVLLLQSGRAEVWEGGLAEPRADHAEGAVPEDGGGGARRAGRPCHQCCLRAGLPCSTCPPPSPPSFRSASVCLGSLLSGRRCILSSCSSNSIHAVDTRDASVSLPILAFQHGRVDYVCKLCTTCWQLLPPSVGPKPWSDALLVALHRRSDSECELSRPPQPDCAALHCMSCISSRIKKVKLAAKEL